MKLEALQPLEMPRSILGELDQDAREKKFASHERKLRDALAGLKDFRFRLLNDPRVLDQAIWLFDTQLWLAQISAEIGGRVVFSTFLADDVREFFSAFKPFAPEFFVGESKPEQPAGWTWSFNGQRLKNPFSKDNRDLTEQAWLRKNHPDLADLLALEADGGPSYSTVAGWQELEKLKKEADAFKGQNPWLRSTVFATETARSLAQAEILKSNKVLAAQLQTETQGPILNPWAVENLTRQAQIVRHDPFLAHVCKLAAVHQRTQLDRELADARERAAKAQFRAAEAKGNPALARR